MVVKGGGGGGGAEFYLTRLIFYYLYFRKGVLGADYLPVKLQFDKETKRIYPEPIKNAKWISVCGKEDTQCQNKCKDSGKRKTQEMKLRKPQ